MHAASTFSNAGYDDGLRIRTSTVSRAVGMCALCLLIISAAEFHVKGTSIPHVDFDVGDSWSGLLPISADPHETRKVWRRTWCVCDDTHPEQLFFWYFPPTANGSENDLIFW